MFTFRWMVRLFSKFLHYERTTDQRVENLEIPLSLVLMEEFFLLFGLLLELRDLEIYVIDG